MSLPLEHHSRAIAISSCDHSRWCDLLHCPPDASQVKLSVSGYAPDPRASGAFLANWLKQREVECALGGGVLPDGLARAVSSLRAGQRARVWVRRDLLRPDDAPEAAAAGSAPAASAPAAAPAVGKRPPLLEGAPEAVDDGLEFDVKLLSFVQARAKRDKHPEETSNLSCAAAAAE